MMFRRLLCVATVVLGGAAPALAQDEPRVGMVAAFPGSVGIVWRATERVDVRPEVSFAWNEFTSLSTAIFFGDVHVGGSETRSSTRLIGTGVAVLVKVAEWERLRAYLVPRFERAWQTTTSVEVETVPGLSLPPGGPGRDAASNVTSTARAWSLSGAAGVRYFLGDRFGVYGETGIEYATTRQPSQLSGATYRSKGVSLRSGVGVILWF